MTVRALGIDVSVWEDNNSTPQHVDFTKAMQNGASFVFIKASQLQADEDMTINWANAKTAGILRGAYHYLDWRTSEIDQAKLFVSLIKDDPGELPPVLDVEMQPDHYGVSNSDAQQRVKNWLEYVKTAIGKLPMIYSGYYFWHDYMSTDVYWATYPLWLAWYADENVIKTPPPWKTWTFWQCTDSWDGKAYGCESSAVDGNYFNGTVDELKTWASSPAPLPPTPIPVPETGIECALNVNGLNVRAGAGAEYPLVDTIWKYNQPTVFVLLGTLTNGYVQLADKTGYVYRAYINPTNVPVPAGDAYYVNVNAINVRKEPSSVSSLVRIIYRKTEPVIYALTSSLNNGYFRLADLTGWVFASYLTKKP